MIAMKSTDVLNEASKRLLEAAFGTRWGEAWVCWSGSSEGWTGKWVKDLEPGDLPDDRDCYFCPSLLKASRRTNDMVERVMVMVIDDVGTKIDREEFEMFAPEASYWIESSPGNFQVGYFIKGGMTVEAYRKLRARMKANPIWGKADGIDPVHLFRLPQGINTKVSAAGWNAKVAS